MIASINASRIGVESFGSRVSGGRRQGCSGGLRCPSPDMHEFLLHLTESGHVSVVPFDLESTVSPAGDDDTAALLEIDRRERLEFPGEAPALSLPAARWAAATFHRACQLLVCRDVPAEAVASALAVPCPPRRSPETHYSVDLVLRYLPDLLAAARRLAAGDPLVNALGQLALAWPLSSVGVAGIEAGDLSEIETFITHRGLRQLYADRILRHNDLDRLRAPPARAAVLASLGHHAGTLGPNLALPLAPTP